MQGSKRDTDVKNGLLDYGRRGGWDDLREQHWNVYITICKTDNQCQVRSMKQGTQSQCSGTTQRDGAGREVGGSGQGDTCVPVGDSC